VRRIFPKVWFDEPKCAAGIDCLGYYHARRDDHRDTGLGPEHDFSSHAADAFGLMAISYEEPSRNANFNGKLNYPDLGLV
jgi:phage terminase large subunit